MSNRMQREGRKCSGTVRRATRSDVAALVLLNEIVQDLHARLYPAHFKTHPNTAEVAKFFLELMDADNHTIGIFESHDGAIGYIWFEEIERPASPFAQCSRLLYVHHLSVKQDRRGQGVGSALLDWADVHARAAGIPQVTVDHWAANIDAHDFFSRKGFHDVRIIMRRAVANPE